MRRILLLGSVLVLAALTVGCMGSPFRSVGNPSRAPAAAVARYRTAVIPPLGILYSEVSAPAVAIAAGERGSRRGEAVLHAIATPPIWGLAPAVDLFTWGDGSEAEAARDGGITRVTHIDYEARVVMLFYRQIRIVVYGE